MVRSLKCDKVCLTFEGILILILFEYATVIFSTGPTVEQKLKKNRTFFQHGYLHALVEFDAAENQIFALAGLSAIL